MKKIMMVVGIMGAVACGYTTYNEPTVWVAHPDTHDIVDAGCDGSGTIIEDMDAGVPDAGAPDAGHPHKPHG